MMDELKRDLRNKKISKETYIVKIMRHIDFLVLKLDADRSPHFRNALAVLASTLFSSYHDDAISKLPKYIVYPSAMGNNIKKRNDYVSEYYTEMLVYDDTQQDIDKLKKIETKLSKLTKLI